MKARIALENGIIFQGDCFSGSGERSGEVVFNTSLSGYQEIITDPSYKGQIVLMTYPLIGNYGINPGDVESKKPFLEGFLVRECSRVYSNWRATQSLPDYLTENDVIGIEGFDTRALTRQIRLKGAMKAVISTENCSDQILVKRARESKGLIGIDLVKEVTCKEPWVWSDKGKFKIVVIDCGLKLNSLRKLSERNCKVTVVPASIALDEIFKIKPDGVLLSNGPGDPSAVTYLVDTVKGLIGKVPLFGICFGHQILGQALGGRTYKLKFGHHGGNHPVKDLKTGKVSITAQNHGFCVDINSLDCESIEVTQVNLNDNTLEGLRHKSLPLFSVQFHPESSPGPHDAEYLFDEFISMIKSYA
ncbi:MAG: glutamine-hydrolyzing carbamoyl-phosphate synthase small subunit [Candidatus Omnitrophica bacterium]|nr:glutamine-hydrolyzing carbamoyl-phosphate synthase small subunit [Candidatus Omnitrophota bacterium]